MRKSSVRGIAVLRSDLYEILRRKKKDRLLGGLSGFCVGLCSVAARTCRYSTAVGLEWLNQK
jgi:hypothetical protein